MRFTLDEKYVAAVFMTEAERERAFTPREISRMEKRRGKLPRTAMYGKPRRLGRAKRKKGHK